MVDEVWSLDWHFYTDLNTAFFKNMVNPRRLFQGTLPWLATSFHLLQNQQNNIVNVVFLPTVFPGLNSPDCFSGKISSTSNDGWELQISGSTFFMPTNKERGGVWTDL